MKDRRLTVRFQLHCGNSLGETCHAACALARNGVPFPNSAPSAPLRSRMSC
jgi:hypothetical protein